MSRYIDVDKFYASQAARCWGEPIIGTCASDNSLLYDELQKLPIYDVIEVIRCKDCKHFDKNKVYRDTKFSFSFCYKFHYNIKTENDFCSYGERIDGGVKE